MKRSTQGKNADLTSAQASGAVPPAPDALPWKALEALNGNYEQDFKRLYAFYLRTISAYGLLQVATGESSEVSGALTHAALVIMKEAYHDILR